MDNLNQLGFMVCNAENQVAKKIDDENWYKYLISILDADINLIDSMISTLSFTHQQYIKNRFILGYSIKQVADIANVDEKSMGNTLQSITDKLENKYKKLI